MPRITIRGVDLNYQIIGNEGPWVTLITGGRRGHDEFIPLAGKIADRGHKVLLHDRRNTGASDVLIEGDDSEEDIWIDDLRELVRHLGIERLFVGGTSSGARMTMRYYLRYPETVLGLLLCRVTGGEFAAGRLPENYYGQFIRAAEEGGMAAVCATEQYQERIQANPRNGEYLRNLPAEQFIAVMSHWLDIFEQGIHLPVMGVSEDALRSFDVPTVIIPGNDKVHSSRSARIAHELIPNSEWHQLPIEDQDIPLIPFEDWAPYEAEITDVFTGFMARVGVG
ncbi:MAG: alpha/beta hydrolase [Rhodospirillaceae bacterium]|jgi:pimeloyl-ACP methyl ester carboxylesterase